MISPRFDVNEKTLPAHSPEDYADPFTEIPTRNNDLQPYIGIIRTSAQWALCRHRHNHHTVRGAMSGALGKKLGLIVTSAKEGDGARIYRISPGLA